MVRSSAIAIYTAIDRRDTYPTTLVETEAPVRLHGRQTDGADLVLLRDFLGSRTVEEVEVDGTTKSTPCQIRGKHKSLHGVCAALVDTVAATDILGLRGGVLRCHKGVFSSLLVDLVVPGVQIEWVVTVDVSINRVASIGGKEGRCEVVAQAQAVDPLTHAVEVVVLRQLCDELNELVLVDQHASPGVV